MALSAAQIQTILDRLYNVLSQTAGVDSKSFEGRSVKYQADIEKKIAYWEGRLARLNGTRPAVAQHDLGNFD